MVSHEIVLRIGPYSQNSCLRILLPLKMPCMNMKVVSVSIASLEILPLGHGKPFDPDQSLIVSPSVLEAAAVGVPDDRLGELVTAIVTVKPAFRGKVSPNALMVLANKRSGVPGLNTQHVANVVISLPKFAVPVMILVREDDFSK